MGREGDVVNGEDLRMTREQIEQAIIKLLTIHDAGMPTNELFDALRRRYKPLDNTMIRDTFWGMFEQRRIVVTHDFIVKRS